MTNAVEYANQFQIVHSLSISGIKDRLNRIVISVEGSLQKSNTSSGFFCAYFSNKQTIPL